MIPGYEDKMIRSTRNRRSVRFDNLLITEGPEGVTAAYRILNLSVVVTPPVELQAEYTVKTDTLGLYEQ